MAEQIFMVDEVADLIKPEQKDQWEEKITKLNLKGQTRLRTEDKSAIPFQYMNNAMINLFRVLCPRATDVDAFDITPIPLRILDIIEVAKQEQYFDKITIQYNESSVDPVVVGIKKTVNKRDEDGYEWITERAYLMARWGDELKNFETLRKEAREKLQRGLKAKYEKRLAETEANLKTIDAECEKILDGETSFWGV